MKNFRLLVDRHFERREKWRWSLRPESRSRGSDLGLMVQSPSHGSLTEEMPLPL